jgi:transcriptional regulator with XRE-family HTH domain
VTSIAPPTPEMKARFGENLERCRERAGLTQTELGYRASLHRTEISLLERGKRLPRIDTAVKLAGCPLGVPGRAGCGHRLEPRLHRGRGRRV